MGATRGDEEAVAVSTLHLLGHASRAIRGLMYTVFEVTFDSDKFADGEVNEGSRNDDWVFVFIC